MVASYTTLATIYDRINMSAFSREMLEKIIDYALSKDWLGQKVMDFGCGTGFAAAWLAEDRFRVIGIDHNEDMLSVARKNSSNAEWHLADIRTIGKEFGTTEMVVAFDTINELDNVKDIQAFLTSAHTALTPDGFLFFDAHTIQGLAQYSTQQEELFFDNDDITMFIRSNYDFERQAALQRHITFIKTTENNWSRQNTERTIKAFPLQVIAALLQRTGFSNINITDERFAPIRAQTMNANRVMFIARK